MSNPKCPICGALTNLKTNKSLKIPFFGCTRFPICKGSVDAVGDLATRAIYVSNNDLETNNTGDNMDLSNNINNKLMDRFFKKVEGVVWDLMTGKIGILGKEGISTLEGEGEDASISLNMVEQFGMPIPAFAQSTPIDSVKSGDLIYVGGKPKGWVVEVKEKAIKGEDGNPDTVNKKFSIISPNGTITTWNPPKVSMLGFDSGVMVLKSLIEMTGGSSGLAGIQGSLMPLMMMGGDLGDMDKIMPLMLMSQMGGAAGGGAAAGANNMIQTMMLMKMMGGSKGGGRGGFFD